MYKVSILVILLLAAPITAHAEDIDNPFHSLIDGLHSLVESLVALFVADEAVAPDYGLHGPWVDPASEPSSVSEPLGPWTDPVGNDEEAAADSEDEPPPLGYGPWADPVG